MFSIRVHRCSSVANNSSEKYWPNAEQRNRSRVRLPSQHHQRYFRKRRQLDSLREEDFPGVMSTSPTTLGTASRSGLPPVRREPLSTSSFPLPFVPPCVPQNQLRVLPTTVQIRVSGRIAEGAEQAAQSPIFADFRLLLTVWQVEPTRTEERPSMGSRNARVGHLNHPKRTL